MAEQDFWLFEGLSDEPYGLLPLNNLAGKGGPTSIRFAQREGSYQWRLEDDTPTILVPGAPPSLVYWPGGKLRQDHGVLIYDVNHLKVRQGSLDAAILAAKLLSDKKKKPLDFGQFDIITDAVNLQKLFAFCQEAGDGLFRIDCERIGHTILMHRVEASDLMEIGHVTFDQGIKTKVTKPRLAHATGPFFQLVSYQFGTFKMLVRYEVDAADYAAVQAPEPSVDESEKLGDRKKAPESGDIDIIEYGSVPRDAPLHLITTYPQGAGFPFFTWAHLFFSAADKEVIGWFKGNGDFQKPSFYMQQDISKMMKPLPLTVLSKVHDCLGKVAKFLIKNDAAFRCGLVWKGKAHLEIYEKDDAADGAVSPGVHDFLATLCKEREEKKEEGGAEEADGSGAAAADS